MQKSKEDSARIGYLSGVLHVVLLAGPSAHAAAGGGAGLLRAAQHDGVLVEVAAPLHRHRHRASLLTHVVAAGAKGAKRERGVGERLPGVERRARRRPLVFEADERPLDVEDVVADHVGLAVLHQELESVHGFLHVLLVEHVADQAQVDVGCKTRTWEEISERACQIYEVQILDSSTATSNDFYCRNSTDFKYMFVYINIYAYMG